MNRALRNYKTTDYRRAAYIKISVNFKNWTIHSFDVVVIIASTLRLHWITVRILQTILLSTFLY